MTSSSPAGGSSTADWIRRFGPFELDLRAGELRRAGAAVKLQPQPFRVLSLLVERAGDLVTREELQQALWGQETYVDFDRGLNFCINQVRAALGDSADAPQFVQTLPRRGYRFIAPLLLPGSESPLSHPRVDSESSLSRPRVDSESSASRPRVDSESSAGPLRVGAVAAGTMLLAMLAVGANFIARQAGTALPADAGRTMLAVLPLEDLTGDPSASWLSDGLTEELIAQIGRVSPDRLGVIARTSAMAYRGSGKTIAAIGRELGVTHVVEGSLRREGNRLRITVQLVDVRDQARVWSDSYDRTVHGSLSLQSEVAAQVTRALALELLPAPWAQPTWSGTRNPEARDAYLRGRFFLNRAQSGDLPAAVTHFDDALRLDPSFAAAHAAKTDAYHLLAMFGAMPPSAAYAEATTAARMAVHLDPDLADAHAAIGVVELWSNWNPAAAAAAFQRALALNPSDAAAHHDYAWALVALERFDEAVAHITRARELDPLSPRASNDIGWLFLQIRQPTEAARACRQTLALDPGSIEAQHCLERAHLLRGEFSEALAAAQAAADRTRGTAPAALQGTGSPEERLTAVWRARLDRLLSASRDRYVSPYTIAMHHAVLAEDDAALDRLEEAYRVRSGMMALLHTDPTFDRLRANPRFLRLVADIQRREP